MSAYIIGRVSVSNLEEYVKYSSQTAAIAAKFGGQFLVKGGAMQQLEGSGPDRHVVIEFPDSAAARAFYDSDEYRAVLPYALANSIRDLVIVEGA